MDDICLCLLGRCYQYCPIEKERPQAARSQVLIDLRPVCNTNHSR